MSAKAVVSHRLGTTQTPPAAADPHACVLRAREEQPLARHPRRRHRGFISTTPSPVCTVGGAARPLRQMRPFAAILSESGFLQGRRGRARLTKPVSRLAAPSPYRFFLYCLVKRLPHFDIEPAGVFAPTLFSANPSRCNLLAVVLAQIVLINICASLIYFDPLLEAAARQFERDGSQ